MLRGEKRLPETVEGKGGSLTERKKGHVPLMSKMTKRTLMGSKLWGRNGANEPRTVRF